MRGAAQNVEQLKLLFRDLFTRAGSVRRLEERLAVQRASGGSLSRTAKNRAFSLAPALDTYNCRG